MTTARSLDTLRLSTLAHEYEREMIRFLHDLAAIPTIAGGPAARLERIRQEMGKCHFQEIRVEGESHILGRAGSGRSVVLMDAGADSPTGVIASVVLAGKLIHELGMYDEFTLWIAASQDHRDRDGIGWLHTLKDSGIRPDCVVLTTPTNLRIHRGHPGHVEIEVRVNSAASGDSATDGVKRLMEDLRLLNQRFKHDAFLGNGSVEVKEICACKLRLDRRLSAGESRETALAEIRALPAARDCEIELLRGSEHDTPAWALGESHIVTRAAVATYEALFELPPVIGKWTGNAEAIVSMGAGVPAIGFGPGEESQSFTPAAPVPVRHLIQAAQFYAAFPMIYAETLRRR